MPDESKTTAPVFVEIDEPEKQGARYLNLSAVVWVFRPNAARGPLQIRMLDGSTHLVHSEQLENMLEETSITPTQ